jgi:hypothetical protein
VVDEFDAIRRNALFDEPSSHIGAGSNDGGREPVVELIIQQLAAQPPRVRMRRAVMAGVNTYFDTCKKAARKSSQTGVHEMRVRQVITLSPAKLKDLPHRCRHLQPIGKTDVMAWHTLLLEFSCDQRFIRV